MYRLGSSLEKVYYPHLYKYNLFDRKNGKKVGTLWRLAKCKYEKISGSHKEHLFFDKEIFVLQGKEEKFLNIKSYGEVLRYLNGIYFPNDELFIDSKNISEEMFVFHGKKY